MIFNPEYYLTKDDLKEPILFYQPDIELRRKALLGIIISDTNPDRPKLKSLRFTLTTKNLGEVVRQIQEAGYFALS